MRLNQGRRMQFSESRGSLTNAVDRDGLSVAFPLECWKVLHNDGRLRLVDEPPICGSNCNAGWVERSDTRRHDKNRGCRSVRSALISFLHVGMTNHSIVDI